MTNACKKTLAALGVVAILLTAGLVRAEEAVVPFNGKDLDAWQCKGNVTPAEANWKVGTAKLDPASAAKLVVEPAADGKGEMVCVGHGRDIYTKQKFGDCTIHVEVMVPKGSNSGVYVMGEYEIQVLDSFGKEKPRPRRHGRASTATPPRRSTPRRPRASGSSTSSSSRRRGSTPTARRRPTPSSSRSRSTAR